MLSSIKKIIQLELTDIEIDEIKKQFLFLGGEHNLYQMPGHQHQLDI